MKKVMPFVSSLLIVAVANTQEHLSLLRAQFLSADSVTIVSHDNTNIYAIDKGTGKRILPSKLILNEKPNQKIIREKRVLVDTAIERLSKILTRLRPRGVIEMGKCFMPHHAVVLFHKSQISFIDICFGCATINTPKNIALNEADFDGRKWDELYDFFIQSGMKYELIFEEKTQSK